MIPLLLICLLVFSAIVAIGAVAPSDPDPPPAAPCPGECVPLSQYQAVQKLAARRLAGWNRANRRILRMARKTRWLLRLRPTDDPWLNQAFCVHGFESTDWRNRGHHFGGMQFNLGTWASAGGRGNPADAAPVEQLYRSFLVWSRDGGSWREWSTAPLCGLR